MKKENFLVSDLRGQGPRRVTPQQQLWELLDEETRELMRQYFRRLKKRDQEDICYAAIAWIRFGIERRFEDDFMESIRDSLLGYYVSNQPDDGDRDEESGVDTNCVSSLQKSNHKTNM